MRKSKLHENAKFPSIKQEKLPTAEQESERLRKEFIELVFKNQRYSKIRHPTSNSTVRPMSHSGFEGQDFKKPWDIVTQKLTSIVEELVGEKITIIKK